MRNPTTHLIPVKALLVCTAGALLGAHTAEAEVINIDFQRFADIAGGGTFDQLGAAPDAPGNTTWNSVQFDDIASPISLVNSSGAASAIELVSHTTTNNMFGSLQTTGAQVANGSDASPLHDAHNLLREFITQFGGSTATLTLGGLDSNTVYDFYLYGGGNNAGDDIRFSINGNTQDTTGVVAATTALTLGEDYVVFTGIAPDTNGQIAVDWQSIPSGAAGFYGLQIVGTPIPEPATLTLLALGGALIASRRRHA